MDNLTHSLAGAVLAQMGLKTKTGLAMPTLIIAANLPDIDAVATLLGGHQHLALRRGITHGPIALVVLPILLWGIMLAWDKWRPNEKRLPVHKGWLLALACIGTVSHPALDWLNNYGIRLLEPFSSRWFYGDTLFIIDIWVWVALAIGVWLSLRRERGGEGNWQRPAWLSFTAVCAYIFLNGAITGVAEASAMKVVTERHPRYMSMADPLVVASPVPVEFWKREILWRDDDLRIFGNGSYSIGKGLNLPINERSFEPMRYLYDPKSGIDRDTAAFMFWSRMPFDQKVGGKTIIGDQRFTNPLTRGRFTMELSARVAEGLERDRASLSILDDNSIKP